MDMSIKMVLWFPLTSNKKSDQMDKSFLGMVQAIQDTHPNTIPCRCSCISNTIIKCTYKTKHLKSKKYSLMDRLFPGILTKVIKSFLLLAAHLLTDYIILKERCDIICPYENAKSIHLPFSILTKT